MSDISNIKIIGIDKDRPPRIRKEAYIDLFFRLSEKASVAWCEDFNALGRKTNPSPKIDIHKGECVETYVKDMTQIEQHLADVKALLRVCNEKFQAKVDEKARVLAATNASLLVGQEGEQYKLNQIVEGLKFDD